MDSVEDWELRTPTAPQLTSLEGARVISVACISQSQELVRSDVRQIQTKIVARELSDTLLSDYQASAHIDTYTLNIDPIAQIQKLQQELAQNKS